MSIDAGPVGGASPHGRSVTDLSTRGQGSLPRVGTRDCPAYFFIFFSFPAIVSRGGFGLGERIMISDLGGVTQSVP